MSNRSSRWPSAAAAVLATLALAAPVSAKCLDDVQAMAKSHGISSQPPTAVPDSKQTPGVTTEDLGRSNGVIAPPSVDDRSVITPRGDGDPGMQTAPDVKPSPRAPSVGGETGRGSGANLGNLDADAARNRTALQAALTAARSSAERGDEQTCQRRLSEAKQIAERPSGK